MSEQTQDFLARLARAAQMRVAGAMWAEIGEALNREVGTVSAWPRDYPEEWGKALGFAIAQFESEYESEALRTALDMLRSDDARAKADAMRALLRRADKIRTTTVRLEHTGLAGGPIELLLNLSDDKLDAIADGEPDTPGEGGEGVAPDAE